MPQINPCIWFDNQAEEAAHFYCSIFPNSKILNVLHNDEGGPGKAGSVLYIEFELDGARFAGLNGGPVFPQTEAVSFVVDCDGQGQVDRYWDALQAGGGTESQCGWLKDRYGVSWQIVPKRLMELQQDPDPARRGRVMAAMMQMVKLEIADLEKAAEG